jgi:hypothetical protein
VSRDEAPLAVVSECLGICFEFEGYDVEGFEPGEALFSFHLPSSIREVVMERVSFSILREFVQKIEIPSSLCFEKCASAT